MSRDLITLSYTNDFHYSVKTAAYEFKPSGRFAFFQKWLWKLLWKMDTIKPHWEDKVKVERIVISRKDLGERLWEAYHKCFPRGEKPSKIFMGPEEFQTLLAQPYDYQCRFGFYVETGWNGRMFNLPVEVIPHMNGVLII